MSEDERRIAMEAARAAAAAAAAAATAGGSSDAAVGGTTNGSMGSDGTPKGVLGSIFSALGTALALGTVVGGTGAAYLGLNYSLAEAEEATTTMRNMNSALTPLAETYCHYRRNIEDKVKEYTDPPSNRLLPDLQPIYREHTPFIRTLVLDLDHVLVYSKWTRERGWQTFKRPGVEKLFQQAWHLGYELVIFSDQMSAYVDPIMDKIDPNRDLCLFRLYRDSTQFTGGLISPGDYVKDLGKLNRDLKKVIYITANPNSIMQKENSLLLSKWEGEPSDTALLDLIPFLTMLQQHTDPRSFDVREIIKTYEGHEVVDTFKKRMSDRGKTTKGSPSPKTSRFGFGGSTPANP